MTLPMNKKVRVIENYGPVAAGLIGTVRMRVDMNGKDEYAVEFKEPVSPKPIKVCKNGAWLPARILEPVE